MSCCVSLSDAHFCWVHKNLYFIFFFIFFISRIEKLVPSGIELIVFSWNQNTQWVLSVDSFLSLSLLYVKLSNIEKKSQENSITFPSGYLPTTIFGEPEHTNLVLESSILGGSVSGSDSSCYRCWVRKHPTLSGPLRHGDQSLPDPTLSFPWV